MLTRLLNAPIIHQRVVALALLASAAAIILQLLYVTISAWRRQDDELTALREQAGQLARIAAMKETARLPATEEGGDLFLEAESVTIARANLQARIGAIAQANGALVDSAANAPDQAKNGVTHIGLQLDISGGHEALHGTIVDIESGMPPLFVRELTVRLSVPESPERPLELAAQLFVYGAFRAAPGSRPPTAEMQVTP